MQIARNGAMIQWASTQAEDSESNIGRLWIVWASRLSKPCIHSEKRWAVQPPSVKIPIPAEPTTTSVVNSLERAICPFLRASLRRLGVAFSVFSWELLFSAIGVCLRGC